MTVNKTAASEHTADQIFKQIDVLSKERNVAPVDATLWLAAEIRAMRIMLTKKIMH